MNSIADSNRVALLVGATLLTSSALVMAQAGSLDPTFGVGGIVTTPNTDTAAAKAIQSDGKIVVAGSALDSQGFAELGLARYNTNGTLDSSFGTGGIVSNADAPAFALALEPDGKILVGSVGSGERLNVLRFSTNGALDTTFGTEGIASLRPLDELFFSPLGGGIAMLSSGKILVAADGGFGGAVLVRLLGNGQLDASFGTDGAGAVPLIGATSSIALLPGGKSLVSAGGVLAARYTSAGNLDTSFGVAGQIPSLGGAAIIPLSNGEFIGVGSLVTANESPTNPQGFSVVRYNANGVVDGTFGTHGGTVTSFPENGYSAAFAVAGQSNGEIVVGGETAANNPAFGQEPANFALARYTAQGQLDTSFGTDGLVTTAFGQNTAFISALAIQSDGKIVAVGSNGPTVFGTPNPGFTLARYLAQ